MFNKLGFKCNPNFF